MIKAILFDLDDTLYTSFDALNSQGYDAVSAWVEQELGIDAAAFRAQAVASRRYYHTVLHAEPEIQSCTRSACTKFIGIH